MQYLSDITRASGEICTETYGLDDDRVAAIVAVIRLQVSTKLTHYLKKNTVSLLLIHEMQEMTHVVVKKWGNSPSVRLPVAIMQAASLNVDDTVDIAVENGRIVIVPVKAKAYSLDTLLAGITSENIHERTDFGKPVGKELL